MRVISLFAGIGGFDLGFEQAGAEIVAHVEKDDSCRKLLAEKFPNALTFDDVCTTGKKNLPPADILCGGWPCQDLSVAGKRAGLAGARSGLFYEFTRIAYESKFAFIVWENVPGLLNSDDGRDMLRVVAEFQRIGYSGGWRTLDAQFLGVAQRRRRVFGVFARRDIGAARCAEILSLYEGVRGHPAPRRETGKSVAGTIGGSSQSGGFRTTDLDNNGAFIPELVNTLSAGAHPGSHNGQDDHKNRLIAFDERVITSPGNRSGVNGERSPSLNSAGLTTIAFQPRIARDGIAIPGDRETAKWYVRRLTPRECERLQGFPDDWTAGFSDSTRYRMLGNAVAVPVVRWIAKRLLS